MRALIFTLKIILLSVLFIFCNYFSSFSQNTSLRQHGAYIFHLNKLQREGTLLNKGWRFHKGDDMKWAFPEFDDTGWKYINPMEDLNRCEKITGNGVCWLRLYLLLDSSLNNKLLAMSVQQNAASEIYLDGKRIAAYGTLSSDVARVKAYNPLGELFPLQFNNNSIHVLAIRICATPQKPYLIYPGVSNSFFSASVCEWARGQQYKHNSVQTDFEMYLFKGSIFTFMFFLHFAFYLFYHRQKVNLHFGLFSFFSAEAFILYTLLIFTIHDVRLSNLLRIPGLALFSISSWFLLEAFYAWYTYKKGLVYSIFFILLFFVIISSVTPLKWNIKWLINLPFFYFPLIVNIECLRISLDTFIKNKKPAINSVAPFVTVFILAMITTLILIRFKTYDGGYFILLLNFLTNITLLSLPVGIFKYTALELRYYNSQLQKAQALKNKIEMDIHDDLGSKLSAIRLFLKRIKIHGNADNLSLLDNSIHLLDTSISDLRQMMNELQTSVLAEKGYITAVEELINKMNHLQQISFILTHNDISKRLEQKTEYNLFRITQELINNTLKYANAKHVTLDIVSRDDKIIFLYEDDGTGFDVHSQNKGFGLSNIQNLFLQKDDKLLFPKRLKTCRKY